MLQCTDQPPQLSDSLLVRLLVSRGWGCREVAESDERSESRRRADTGVLSIIQASVGELFCSCHFHLNKTNTQSL